MSSAAFGLRYASAAAKAGRGKEQTDTGGEDPLIREAVGELAFALMALIAVTVLWWLWRDELNWGPYEAAGYPLAVVAAATFFGHSARKRLPTTTWAAGRPVSSGLAVLGALFMFVFFGFIALGCGLAGRPDIGVVLMLVLVAHAGGPAVVLLAHERRGQVVIAEDPASSNESEHYLAFRRKT